MERAELRTDESVSLQKEDAFQRYPFAQRVASLIKSHSTVSSYVIGINGKWGEGKTSVLNFIRTELALQKDVIIVDFNPWLFSSDNQLFLSFFQILAAGIEEPFKGKSAKIGEVLRDYAGALGVLGSMVGLSGAKGLFEEVGKKLSEKPLDHYKKELNKVLEASNKKVVVVIDDIDRLNLKEIQQIFKLIKLAADFKNTVYLLSFDDELVASALDSEYSKGGYDYLEKIIQLPLRLPKARPEAVKQFTLASVEKSLKSQQTILKENELDRFSDSFSKYLLNYIDNPRFASRYSNSVFFHAPLLEGNVNMVDLLLIEGVKVLFPNLYTLIRENPGLFTRSYSSSALFYHHKYADKDEAKEAILSHLESYPKSKHDSILNLLQELFPQLHEVFDNRTFMDKTWRDWYVDKRICSGFYFERYFTYSVAEGDISDVFFEEFLSKLSSEDFIDKRVKLFELIQEINAEALAFKLLFIGDSVVIDNDSRYLLAKNLCLLGSYLPSPKAELSIMKPFRRVGSFLKKCVAAQTENRRIELARELVLRAEPLDFAFSIWLSVNPTYDEFERENLFPPEKFIVVSGELYNRSRSLYSLEELPSILEEQNFRYLLLIGAEQDSAKMKSELENIIEKGAEMFLQILYAFSQATYPFGGEPAFKSSFSEAYYLLLEKVVDIGYFYKKSQELFGNNSGFEPTSGREELSDKQLVGWFQRIYLSKRNQADS